MSLEETHAKKLPPFGITGLNPPKSCSVLHISAPQYDSTLKSYPEAVLTYLDDDDGETITVGSGHELQQRLEEPVKPGRGVGIRSVLPSRRDSFDLIHLFDIRHTANNLGVWREHEAYSSKSLREFLNPPSTSGPAETTASTNQLAGPIPATKTDVTHPVLPVQPAKPMNVDAEEARETLTEPIASSQPSRAPSVPAPNQRTNDSLRDFMETNIGTFADFLDSAAEVLRNVAQKTREADASPVESMLNGMKDILSEVGQLGMEVLNGLDYEPVPSKEKKQPAPPAKVEVEKTEPKEDSSQIMKPTPSLSKRVSFANMADDPVKEKSSSLDSVNARKSLAERLTDLSRAEDRRKITSNLQNLDKANRPELEQLGNLRTLLASIPKAAKSDPKSGVKAQDLDFKDLGANYRNFPNRPGPAPRHAQQPPVPAATASIMDLETSNPEFAARYPPLMSLRRAKTVSDLHKNKQSGSESMNTKTALHRYPSIGQLEARRKPYDVHHNKRGKPSMVTNQRDSLNTNTLTSLVSPVSPIASDAISPPHSARKGYKSPSVEDEPVEKTETLISTRSAGNASNSKPANKPLPGAWPESKTEDMSALPIANESSGAFFNRMTGIKEPESVPKRSVSPALSCRNTSPPADPFWPSSGLRRANTVTASNPAARLTRPFDPMSSAPNPLFPRGNAQAAPVRHSTQPKRSHTQRERPRPDYTWNNSTVGGPTLWGDFPQSAQIPLMQPPFPQGPPYPFQPRPGQPIPSGRNFNDFLRPQTGPTPPPTTDWAWQHGMLAPLPISTSKEDDCVKALRQMGYGLNDPNEAARLNVYAGAAAGDVMEAVDMIEEDRQVVASMKHVNGSIRTL